jgi:hypothetical protein
MRAKNLGGRAYLVKKLRARGLSRRKAVAVVNAILEAVTKKLLDGKTVKFPFGSLRRTRRHFSKEWDAVDDWPAHRDGYTVEYEIDPAGYRELDGLPPAPERGRPRKAGSGK